MEKGVPGEGDRRQLGTHGRDEIHRVTHGPQKIQESTLMMPSWWGVGHLVTRLRPRWEWSEPQVERSLPRWECSWERSLGSPPAAGPSTPVRDTAPSGHLGVWVVGGASPAQFGHVQLHMSVIHSFIAYRPLCLLESWICLFIQQAFVRHLVYARLCTATGIERYEGAQTWPGFWISVLHQSCPLGAKQMDE